MNKQEYKLIRLKSKLVARKRMKQFFIFAFIIVPVVVALAFLFNYVDVKAWLSIIINAAVILAFWAVYFYLIIKPLERYQAKLKQKKKESNLKDGQN